MGTGCRMRPMTRRRFLILIGTPLLTLLVGSALYIGVAWVIVEQALVAEAKPFEQTPEELGLAYEDIAFAPRGWDGITLRGWYFPNPGADATVVLVHGLDGTRSGDLELVRDLLARGFAALTFDLRGHGESDRAQMGAALREQDDVLGAVDFVLSERGAEPGRVLLLGFSYGGAIVLLTGVQEPAVAGVYADSAFASMADVLVKEVADRTPVSLWGARVLEPGIVRASRWFKGIDLAAVRPEAAASEYGYVLGLAHCEDDERISIDHLWRLRDAASMEPRLAVYSGCEHAGAYDEYPVRYVEELVSYFNERLGE